MNSFTELQAVMQGWRAANFPVKSFPTSSPIELHVAQQVMGVCEEVGELSHAVLKMQQGIRGTRQEHLAAAADAIGDIIIYITGVCDDLGLSLADCVATASQEVLQRDWVSNPQDGGTSMPPFVARRMCTSCGASFTQDEVRAHEDQWTSDPGWICPSCSSLDVPIG